MNNLALLTTVCLAAASAHAQWNQAAPANAPSPRLETQMAYDAGNGVTVLFGGADTSGFPPMSFADTWTWDGTDWTALTPAASPPGRYFGSMAYDQQRQVTVLYGGLSPTFFGANYLDDTWEWDGTNWTQVTTANSPGSYLGNPGVGEICMAYDLVGQRTVLFGGELFQGIVPAPAVTFEYDGTDWTQINTGTQPERRSQASLCTAPTLGGVLLFGGTNFNNPPGPNGEIVWNDTWVYSSTTSTWTQIVPNGPVPPARAGASLEFDPNTGLYVMHGGYDSTMTGLTALSDTWVFDGATSTWTDVTAAFGSPTAPLLRFETALGPGGCTVLFGGSTAVFGTLNNNTWIQGCVASAAVYGTGCSGSNGVPTLTASTLPVLGGSFDVAATNFEATGSVGFMGIGTSDTVSPLGPLPLGLAPFGLAASCQLLTSADDTALISLSAGAGTFSVPIPSSGSLLGFEAFFQGASFDAAATGGVAVSNGIAATVGY